MDDKILGEKIVKNVLSLGIKDFATLFNVSQERFSSSIKEEIETTNFKYYRLNRNERDSLLLKILKEINEHDLQKVGSQRKNIWESCWNTHKDNLKASGFNFDQCVPLFVKNYRFIRLNQDYIETEDTNFLYNATKLLLKYIFEEYLVDISCLYEFGCGSGHNLVPFAKLYPQKNVADWTGQNHQLRLLI